MHVINVKIMHRVGRIKRGLGWGALKGACPNEMADHWRGCGFLGTALTANFLAEGGHQNRVLDNLTTGTRADLENVRAFRELDVRADPSDWTEALSLLEGGHSGPCGRELGANRRGYCDPFGREYRGAAIGWGSGYRL